MKETGERDNKKMDNQKIEVWYRKLEKMVRAYLPEEDIAVIRSAFELARDAHAPQTRESGEPYIIHPLNVAIILAELKSDKETMVAGLLHDVVEDTGIRYEEIRDRFGEEVAFLVDGVTKIARLHEKISKKQIKQESFLKLLSATHENVRVAVIKLADRLHNMRTMQFQPEDKQISISEETLEIYAPIAQKLGISFFSKELEDLAFSYLKPEACQNIRMQVEGNDYCGKIRREAEDIRRMLEDDNIPHELNYYEKHLFSIYRKMKNRKKTINELYDICVLRILVEKPKDCYRVLGTLHCNYKILPGRIKDYISLPKENMYQALHTTLFSKSGMKFKVRILTKEMELLSKYGIQSYLNYSVGREWLKKTNFGESFGWLTSIFQWKEGAKNTAELMDLVKGDFDLFTEKIYCFTPNAEEKHLPKGSTVLDFAYAVHSEIGDKTIGALINDRRRNIDAPLNNGDIVFVLTDENSEGPQESWLEIVRTATARSNIRKRLRQNLNEGAVQGEPAAEEESGEEINIQMGRCCLPVRGDLVIGVMSNPYYLTVHRNGCETAGRLLKRREFREKEIRWEDIESEEFNTTLAVLKQEGAGNLWFSEVWAYLGLHRHFVSRMEFLEKRNRLMLTISVRDKDELEEAEAALRKISGVASVTRMDG
ncbi:MAG: RelA/SpoT family protein [Peptostreptococcaceae bacterium]|nr:RelA/SpoT family protein [Peptostreptococcaceae bacterium]